MAFGIRLDTQDWREYGGAVALAPIVDLADLRAPRLTAQFENGQLVEAATVAADVLNILPDGTLWGDALNGASRAAAFALARDFTSSRLNQYLTPAAATPAAPATPTPTASPAAAASAQPGLAVSAGAASAFDQPQAAF